MLATAHVCGVSRSILGQPWRWRGLEGERRDEGFAPDDLVTQLLLSRGVSRDALEQHRIPTIRPKEVPAQLCRVRRRGSVQIK